MKLETIINELKDLKKTFENEISLKDYCKQKNLSCIFVKTKLIAIEIMDLRSAYIILDFYPDYDVSYYVLNLRIHELQQIKKDFEYLKL